MHRSRSGLEVQEKERKERERVKVKNALESGSKSRRRSRKASSMERESSMATGKAWTQVRTTKKAVSAFKLSEEDMKYLKENTHYNEKEIKDWYRGFRSDCPDGQLHKSKILEIYQLILPAGDSSTFVDQIFRIFDKDGNGSIDFKEFMLATDMTAAGTAEEKLKWAFKLYDSDNSGAIDIEEMTDAICTLYDMTAGDPDSLALSPEQAKTNALAKAEKIFSVLDGNGDGELTMEEFVTGCMQDEELIERLAPPAQPQDEEEDANDENN